MTEKELKKLNRYQLLELLVMQTERADKLEKKVDELERKLQDRNIRLSKLGSIAEASMHITEVFEASQNAADLYLEAAKRRADGIVAYARHQAASIIMQAEAQVCSNLSFQQDDCDKITGSEK